MVRMGKNPKGWANEAAKQLKRNQRKPTKSSLGLQVGRVSPILISSIYSPLLLDLAVQSSEEHAALLIALRDREQQQVGINETLDDGESISSEQDMDDDTTTPPLPSPPNYNKPYLFSDQTTIDEFTDLLKETSRTFTSSQWKVRANAAKFQRRLDEKYGFFLPFVKRYPQTEVYVKSFQKKLHMGDFSPLRRGDGPLNSTSSVILLFMLYRNGVRNDVVCLAALFLLVGLRPWALVLLVTIGKFWLDGRKKRKKAGFPDTMTVVDKFYETSKDGYEYLRKPVGESLEKAEEELLQDRYDVIVLGSGISSLYTAALLSRAGRKVLVLSPEADASGTLTLQTTSHHSSLPFDGHDTKLTNIDKIQRLLAPALATTSDPQGGIRFVPIGTPSTGHAYDILSIPSCTDPDTFESPFILRPGGACLTEDASLYFNDTDNASTQFHALCGTIHASAAHFYLTKLSDSFQSGGSTSNDKFAESAIRPARPLLEKCFATNPRLQTLFAAIGCRFEDVSPSRCSMGVMITNVATMNEYFYYPVGGLRGLGHALANVIAQCDGRVVTDASVSELLFEEEKDESTTGGGGGGDEKETKKPKCIGVKLSSGTQLKLSRRSDTGATIVSDLGFIPTFLQLFPESIRCKHGVPDGLPALTERRPHFKLLLVLNGTKDELEIPSADYWRVSSSLPMNDDENDTTTTTTRRTKFATSKSFLRISFPSAKDPSWNKAFPNISTGVVTVEADDDFVRLLDTKPKIYMKQKYGNGEKERLIERIMKDLLEIYPQLEGKITQTELHGPISTGLSHTPERYAAKGIKPLSNQYANLALSGKDLTLDTFSGAIVGGWMAANAVLGYDYIDYSFLEKNVTEDLSLLLNYPKNKVEEEAFPLGDTEEEESSSKDPETKKDD